MRKYVSSVANLDEFVEIAKLRGIDPSFAIEGKYYASNEKKADLYEAVINTFDSEDDIYDFTDIHEKYQNRIEDELVFLLSKKSEK